MIVLGLTGSIGMGKTTLAAMLEQLKIPVHNSDTAVHNLLTADEETIRQVSNSFPTSYDKKTKSINRQILGGIIFTDDTQRLHLESILHPRVHTAQEDFLNTCRNKKFKLACLDIPLLFETNAQSRVDYTIVVSAPDFIQKARVLSRPNMTEEIFNCILARQMPDAEKRKRADYVIATGLGLAHTRKSLNLVLKDIASKENPKKEEPKINDPRNRPRY